MELENKVYPPEYRSESSLTKQRLAKNPFTDLALVNKGALMGYISLYPIPSFIYQELSCGELNEKRVEQHMLSYEKMGFYHAYLCSMVIDKQHYPRLNAMMLFSLLKQHLQRLKKRGIFIQRIIAHAVSTAGRKTLKRMKFVEIKPNVFVYRADQKHYCYRFVEEICSFFLSEQRYEQKMVDV